MAPSRVGSMVGAMFSSLRQQVIDRVIDGERSYRGTLLGLRHGTDLVKLVGHVAAELGDTALVDWCDSWLDVREPIVQQVEQELAWFARHPRQALEPAHGS